MSGACCFATNPPKTIANNVDYRYKPMGVMKFADGKTDLTEICAVSRDSILDATAAPIPQVYAERRELLQSLIRRLHPIAMLLLGELANHLEIPKPLLEHFHDLEARSATILRFLHNPPQPTPDRQASLLGHTDSGSLTILFAQLGGLQILPNDINEDANHGWQWVKPEPGCVIVNIGDPMVQWTGGILRSAFHRVLYAPGAQANENRYSFGYFLKPADEASMQRIQEGGLIPRHSAQDPEVELPKYHVWHQNKTRKVMTGNNGNISRGGIRTFSKPSSRVPLASEA